MRGLSKYFLQGHYLYNLNHPKSASRRYFGGPISQDVLKEIPRQASGMEATTGRDDFIEASLEPQASLGRCPRVLWVESPPQKGSNPARAHEGPGPALERPT